MDQRRIISIAITTSIFLALGGGAAAAPAPKKAAPSKACKIETASTTVRLPRMTPSKPRKNAKGDSRTTLEGTTGLVLNVGPKGQLLDAHLAQSSGNQLVDNAALDAVKGASFKAGTIHGKAKAMCYRIDFPIKIVD